MLWLVLLLSLVVKTQQGGIVGNPLAHAYPCKNNTEILASFEAGLPPGEENRYTLNIIANLVKHSLVKLKFDSPGTVKLSDPTKARIHLNEQEKTFHVKFFKESPNLHVQVIGPASGTIPYVESIVLNGDEICTASKKPGYFDDYIVGVRDTAEVTLTVPDGTCGRRKVTHTELIVNGLPTKPGDWPWHVAMFRLEGSFVKYICGGTLLSKSLILTAAHCVTIRGEPVIPSSLSIVLGKHNLIGGDIAPQEREAFEIIVHPEYNAKKVNNDIALLRLKSEASFDDYVQPACLGDKNDHRNLPAGDVFATVVGWGFNHKDVLSTTLQQISIPIVSDATCIKSNPVFFGKQLNNRKFCAGFTNGTSACNGDSGGGLMVFIPDTPGSTDHGRWVVRGIVSLSVSRTDAPICDPYQYTLFTNVDKYVTWIKGYMK